MSVHSIEQQTIDRLQQDVELANHNNALTDYLETIRVAIAIYDTQSLDIYTLVNYIDKLYQRKMDVEMIGNMVMDRTFQMIQHGVIDCDGNFINKDFVEMVLQYKQVIDNMA